MSTLKVDTLDTRTGSGNITVSRPLSGSGASLTSLPAANLTGAMASGVTGVGKVLQVVESVRAGQVGSSSTSWTDTLVNASITPASTSNKFLIIYHTTVHLSQADKRSYHTLFRGTISGTELASSVGLGVVQQGSDAGLYSVVGISLMDSPSTTSSQTYTAGFKAESGLTHYVQINNITSTMQLMEIAG